MNPRLTSIIIINYDTADLTLKLLDSIKQHCRPDTYEIILVDNGSREGTIDKIKAKYGGIICIENKRNLGFARAANQAVDRTRGEYLWFLNSDCLLKEPIIERLQETLELKRDIAAVSPRTVDENGKFHSVCRNFPTYRNIIFSRGSLLSGIPGFEKYESVYTLPDFEEMAKVDAIAGTAMFIRRDDFRVIGGFDERFFLYFEDTDLCYRLSREGRGCYYVPEVSLVHAYQGSSQGRQVSRLFHHHLSALEYFLKWHPDKWLGNLCLFFLLTVNLVFQIILTYAGLRRNNRR
jgi:GT2 family glycosyltransferase